MNRWKSRSSLETKTSNMHLLPERHTAVYSWSYKEKARNDNDISKTNTTYLEMIERDQQKKKRNENWSEVNKNNVNTWNSCVPHHWVQP